VKAVILAAGAGRRLQSAIGMVPKCLAQIGGRTLLERQMTALREHGVDDITLVLGHQHNVIADLCGREVEIVYNPLYASTNSLYSFWLARNLLSGAFVVMNSDVLFHPHLLTRLLTSSHDDALLMSAREPGERYSEEEMKVHVRDGCVAAIDKALEDCICDGENVGIAKFGPEGGAVVLAEANALVEAGGTREWLPRAFHAFSQKRPLHVIETDGYPWIEIDFPEDYARACSEVLPAIDATQIVTRAPRVAHNAVNSTFGRVFHRV
jgi:L-glutamine-phosphate cytidylyltransferase